jgi:hypothetical protein
MKRIQNYENDGISIVDTCGVFNRGREEAGLHAGAFSGTTLLPPAAYVYMGSG